MEAGQAGPAMATHDERHSQCGKDIAHPCRVASRPRSLQCAVEMDDGSFVLAGFSKNDSGRLVGDAYPIGICFLLNEAVCDCQGCAWLG